MQHKHRMYDLVEKNAAPCNWKFSISGCNKKLNRTYTFHMYKSYTISPITYVHVTFRISFYVTIQR